MTTRSIKTALINLQTNSFSWRYSMYLECSNMDAGQLCQRTVINTL